MRKCLAVIIAECLKKVWICQLIKIIIMQFLWQCPVTYSGSPNESSSMDTIVFTQTLSSKKYQKWVLWASKHEKILVYMHTFTHTYGSL